MNKLFNNNPQSKIDRISTLVDGKVMGKAIVGSGPSGGLVSQYYSTSGLAAKPSLKP